MKKLFRTMGRKIRLGRYGLPVWSMALALVAIAAVAGQAVGPVLAGSVTGKAGVVVSQTVVLDAAPTTANTNDDFAATVNDEGTEFTVAIETQVGQYSGFSLSLGNLSGANANGILELNAPAALDIYAQGANDASSFAQLNKTTYLMVVDNATSNATADVTVTIESKDDAAPGFYTITGRIIQVAN